MNDTFGPAHRKILPMKILVINISLRPEARLRLLPVGLGYVVSAMKRAGFEFDLLDLDAHPQPPEKTEAYLRTHQYDVVAMGCIVTGYRYVKWLCHTIKSAFPKTTIVVGNTVAQSILRTLLSKTEADIAVMGEADETIVELLGRLQTSGNLEGIRGIWYRQKDEIIAQPPRPVIEDVDQIPTPDWDIFDIETYIQSASKRPDDPLPPIPPEQIRSMQINTARGCPFKCTFCYHTFRGETYRWRSPASIINEMRLFNQRYGINHFTFHDELTFFSIKQTLAFAEALQTSGLQVWWMADCRSGLFTEPEHVAVAKKLKAVGCLSLSFSLESSDPEILKWMDKKVGPEVFLRQVDLIRQADISMHTSLVFGYPNETEATIKATIDCCIEAGIYPSAGYLLPQPGTPMYDYAREKGYIKDEEAYLLALGDRQDLRLNMTQLTDERLETTVKRELERCNQALGLELPTGGLIKTGFYRDPKKLGGHG
jgi:anaerobic magnesium-protoporphyrin IX monomethyl ester cyclase